MQSLLTKVSANQLRQAASILDQIQHLERKLTQVLGTASGEWPADRSPKSRINRTELRIPSNARTERRTRKHSPAAKRRLSLAAKRRWKAAKAAGKTTL
jgi:hypothetical protein